MRLIILVALLFLPASVYAQPSRCSDPVSSLLQFDPYKPSHAAIVRNYGATVLAQAPLESLMKLDPYVPSQAALLRQLGGAIPVWPYAVYPGYPPTQWTPQSPHGAPCEPAHETAAAAAAAAATITTFDEALTVLEQRQRGAMATPNAGSSARNQGVGVEYDGRMWMNAGPAVRFSEAEFVRVGERGGSPIFRRVGGDDTVIYVRTTLGMVAPFRSAP